MSQAGDGAGGGSGRGAGGGAGEGSAASRRRRLVALSLGGLGLLLVLAQLIPVERSNPPVVAEVEAPAEVRAVLERACYDCHSHATRWPWYSRVAPVSWLLAHDVEEGREHLNFSDWPEDELEREELITEVYEEVREGEMPLWFYLPLHPEAQLGEADVDALRRWAGALR